MKYLALFFLLVTFSMQGLAIEGDEQADITGAIENGNTAIVEKSLNNGLDVNEKYFGWTALQIAANKGQLAIVKLLVDRGADLNYRHPVTKMTALHLAAFNGSEDIVKYLVEKGADINIKMRAGVSIVRAIRDEKKTSMLQLLSSLGAKDDGCLEEKCF